MYLILFCVCPEDAGIHHLTAVLCVELPPLLLLLLNNM
jgi:hypothetical protein